jgi:hypothetical protein
LSVYLSLLWCEPQQKNHRFNGNTGDWMQNTQMQRRHKWLNTKCLIKWMNK